MNCRPGDLAIIVGSRHFVDDPDIGKIVRVIEFLHLDEPCWGVSCSVPLLVHFPFGEVRYANEAAIADRHLKPIRGSEASGAEIDAQRSIREQKDLQFSEGEQANAI